MIHDFRQKLEYSLGERQTFDTNILKTCFAECVEITKTPKEIDKLGVDYIAHLSGGATINIDAKTREKGASKFWHFNEPELALEIWSVIPSGTNPGKLGWTLSDESQVDYILYTFDKSDTDRFYLLPFQLLRTAFKKNGREWNNKYIRKKQNSRDWQSEALFIPASVVLAEINKLTSGTTCC